MLLAEGKASRRANSVARFTASQGETQETQQQQRKGAGFRYGNTFTPAVVADVRQVFRVFEIKQRPAEQAFPSSGGYAFFQQKSHKEAPGGQVTAFKHQRDCDEAPP